MAGAAVNTITRWAIGVPVMILIILTAALFYAAVLALHVAVLGCAAAQDGLARMRWPR